MPEAKPVISNEGYVEKLTRYGKWATPLEPIAFAFLEQKPGYFEPGAPFIKFSEAQRSATVRAFGLIDDVANLSFVQVADNGKEPGPSNSRITFHAVSVDQQWSGSTGAYAEDESAPFDGAGIMLNNYHIQRLTTTQGYADWQFLVILHEILHGLGMSHPGDYNGPGYNYEDHAQFQQDTKQYSVMSYFSASYSGADHIRDGVHYVAQTPLLFDILALQTLYGANMTTRTGDTVYGFNSNAGAAAFDFAVNAGPVIAIWDAGGKDSLDLSGYSTASLINLNDGEFSDAAGLTRNIAIAFGTMIENAVGGAGDDTLIGNEAANLLDGGAGGDTMRGGLGDDTYIVGQAGDVVEELSGEGDDRVRSAISFTLGANVERLTLTGTAAIDGTGNGLANILFGNAGKNVLDGGGGADAMAGGDGNDIYVVDNAGDKLTEAGPAGGIDLVRSSVSFALGADIEKLALTGTADLNGTGNALNNTLTGNAGKNLLDGKSGADLMSGGDGSDVYVVDDAGDKIVEAAGAAGGIDLVKSGVSFALGDHVEKLTLTGTGDTNATGNGLANVLVGNIGMNSLKAGGGDDVLDGGADDDRLFGGAGADTLTGGTGKDRFYFDAALDPANADRITDFAAADDTIFLSRAVFAAIAANGPLAAAAFRLGTAAADADDRIVYDAASGRIFYDGDGSGAGSAILFAQVNAGTAMTHADFTVFG